MALSNIAEVNDSYDPTGKCRFVNLCPTTIERFLKGRSPVFE